MILFLDLLSLSFIIGLGYIGFKRGLVEELGRLLGLIVAISFSWGYYLDLSGVILNLLNINPWVVMVFSFITIFIAFLLGMRIVTKLIHIFVMTNSTKMLNKGMGFAFGAMKGGLVIMLFLWMVDIVPKYEFSEIIHSRSMIASFLKTTRSKVIHTFNLEDPVAKSEKFVQKLLSDSEKGI